MRFARRRGTAASRLFSLTAFGGAAVFAGTPGTRAEERQPKPRMVEIAAGNFARADGRSVRVDSFSLLSHEVTWSQFQAVRDWAGKHGYDFEEGIGQENLPAQNITWHDAVKWCNALSEMCGLRPAYFTDLAHQAVYRQGRADLAAGQVDWKSRGYRLPTEAEWEFAYRAGTTTAFYWGDFPREAANNHDYAAFHVWGRDEIDGGPIPIGEKRPNAWGLHDMAGNVEEWVWDRYAIGYEGVASDNPRGPDSGPLRVLRGGGFVIDRIFTAASRHPTFPFFVNCDNGFRIASSAPRASARELAALPVLPAAPRDRDAFAEPVRLLDQRPDTDEAVCLRLLPFLNLEEPALASVRTAYRAKQYDRVLAALRDLYAARLRAGELAPFQPDIFDARQTAAWLAVRRKGRPIRWAGPEADLKDPWTFDVSDHLAKAYAKTGELEYAEAFFWMANDAALRAKPTWNRLTKSEKGSAGSPRDSMHAFIGFDAGHPLRVFADIALMLRKGLPADAVPPRVFANSLYSAIVDRLGAGLQDDRGNMPNQIWGNGTELLEFTRLFAELNDAAFLRDEAIARIRKATGTVMPDGSDLEASLNYNVRLLSDREKLNAFFPDRTQWPGWLVEFNQRADNRARLFAALASPFGTFPGIGNQNADDLRARLSLAEWREQGLLRGLETPPVFDSVSFPYGGYHVQRSGWEHDDHYFFFRSSRDGVGHTHRDNNNLQLAAHGAWLLCDRGSPAYTAQHLPAHQKKYLKYFDEEPMGSVFAANCLSVDGLGQATPARRLIDPVAGWTTPRENLVHHSARFDLVEGVYEGDYASEKPIGDNDLAGLVADHGAEAMAEIVAYNDHLKTAGARRLRATHRRVVVFLRDEKFWVVLDEVDGGAEFTQTWNFPPADRGLNTGRYFLAPPGESLYRDPAMSAGYNPSEVRADDAGQRVVTISHRRPNIAILNFSPAPVRYRRHYGAMFPFRGWHSFGIVGEKIPAVAVEGSWSGDAPMVTALYPMKSRPPQADTLDAGIEGFSPRNADGVSGFSYSDDARSLVVQASREVRPLRAGAFRGHARLLIVRETGEGEITGLALGCEALSRADDADARAPATGDFEFSFHKGRWTSVPVRVPETFRWRENAAGRLAPVYQP